MINLKEYLDSVSLESNIVNLDGEFYFIDTNIWYQGKLKPPRILNFKQMSINQSKNEVTFLDKDGDEYTIDINEIYDSQEEVAKAYYIKSREYEEKINK